MFTVWVAEFCVAVDRLFRVVHASALAAFEGFWLGQGSESLQVHQFTAVRHRGQLGLADRSGTELGPDPCRTRARRI